MGKTKPIKANFKLDLVKMGNLEDLTCISQPIVLYFFLYNAFEEKPLRINRNTGQRVPSVADCKLATGGLEDRRMFRIRNSNLLRRITNPLLIYCLVTLVLCVHTAAALPGSGTQQDPFRIESIADFDEFAADPNYWSGFTRLETDVNLAGRTYTTAVIAPDVDNSNNYFEGTPFTGVFDGNAHKIIGLTIDGGANDYLGLFGFLGRDSEVRNLRLEGGSVSGRSYVGGLVGSNVDTISKCYSTGYVNGTGWCIGGLAGVNVGIITNCYSTSSVTGISSVGGLVGENFKGTISTCYSSGSVNGYWYVGGLMGLLDMGSVSNCYSTSDVNGSDRVGGLVGWNLRNVSNSYSTGSVSGNESVGGLVGYNVGIVSNCYSTGDVNGVEVVGGLVGGNGFFYPFVVLAPGNIFNSYSTGKVQGVLSVGGLVGYNYYGDIEMSFWDVETSGEPNMCGGQWHDATGCDPNCGKTTNEMKTIGTFTDAGWDFVEIWGIGEQQTYPYLRFAPAGDLNYDKKVDLFDLAILGSHWLEGRVD